MGKDAFDPIPRQYRDPITRLHAPGRQCSTELANQLIELFKSIAAIFRQIAGKDFSRRKPGVQSAMVSARGHSPPQVLARDLL